MLISVIIPTFQPAEYFWQCFDSLMKQTLSADLFEVIIVLNGCNEPYHSVLLDGLSKRMKQNVNLLQTDVAGVSNARNIGINESKGDYLCFVDDDDWVSPTYLQSLLECSWPGTLAVSNVLDFDETTSLFRQGYLSRAFKRMPYNQSQSLFRGRSFMSSCCCKLIPRKQVVADRRFNTSFRLGEDAFFMASISDHINSVTAASENAIYYRRLRATSASRKQLPFGIKTGMALRLTLAYVMLYLRHPLRYNLPFFISRIVASLQKIVKPNWI